jgi:hypothetical protein
MRTISLKEVMRRLYSGETASLHVVQYSASRDTGGEIKYYPTAKLNLRAETKLKIDKPEFFDIATENKNMPIYRTKQYVNILLPSGELKKIYRTLIVKFNNLIVRI